MGIIENTYLLRISHLTENFWRNLPTVKRKSTNELAISSKNWLIQGAIASYANFVAQNLPVIELTTVSVALVLLQDTGM